MRIIIFITALAFCFTATPAEGKKKYKIKIPSISSSYKVKTPKVKVGGGHHKSHGYKSRGYRPGRGSFAKSYMKKFYAPRVHVPYRAPHASNWPWSSFARWGIPVGIASIPFLSWFMGSDNAQPVQPEATEDASTVPEE